jgi:hypothetical protein
MPPRKSTATIPQRGATRQDATGRRVQVDPTPLVERECWPLLVAEYAQGATLAALGKRYGFDWRTVSRALRKAGHLRRPGEPLEPREATPRPLPAPRRPPPRRETAVDAIALGHQLEGSLPVGVRVVAIRAIGRSVEKTRDRG